MIVNLTQSDLEMLKTAGVSPLILQNGVVRRVTHEEARELCGIRYKSDHLEGLAFAYHDPEDDQIVRWRVRRDHPEVERDGTPIAKYLATADRPHLYFVPGCYTQLGDTTSPVIFAESEKAILAIASARFLLNRTPWPLIIGTGGCWGWRGITGKATSPNGARVDEKGPLPDLDRITWTDRDTIIVFDANAATNPKVQAARRALASELAKRGAKVRIAELPIEDGVNGPDDFIGKHGGAAFFALVDAAQPLKVGKSAAKGEKSKQGSDVQFAEAKPWPTPVDGAVLLDSLSGTFSRYLALPKYASTALALWVLHTYTFEAWFASPFLAITSPEKRCGKTMLLIVLGALVPRRMFASNVTPAVLFRAIEKYRPTLLIDEADTFIRDNDELRGVLNSGHTRTTAVVIRAVGDDHDPRAFSTWCPKAIALIGRLPGTLDDRAVEVRMRRRTAGERVQRLRQDRIDGDCEELRRQAVRWAADHVEALKPADPDTPEALHDRAADCWRPLLAVADAAGGTWSERSREAALKLSGMANEEAATTRLLSDIRAVFTEDGNPEVMASSAILERLIAIEDRPWKEWSQGRPLSGAKLANMLKSYDVIPAGSIRVGTKTARAYRRASFLEAWDRYLTAESDAQGDPEACQRDNVNDSGDLSRISKRDNGNACHVSTSVTNPMNTDGRHVVTDQQPLEDVRGEGGDHADGYRF
jgi:putative DNA primase/helicase